MGLTGAQYQLAHGPLVGCLERLSILALPSLFNYKRPFDVSELTYVQPELIHSRLSVRIRK